ncbi:MAG: flexitail domain-containing putative surface protein [Dehalococcoidia bacterium]
MRRTIALTLLTIITAGAALLARAPAAASGVIITAIEAGYLHTCAITDTGGLKCWGFNGFGQLGDGSGFSRPVPVDVIGLDSGVAAVAPGWYHTCALTIEGGVKCWGWNIFGQLGTTGVYCIPDEPLFPCSAVPVDVKGLESGGAAVSTGSFHSCALTTSGGVKCWGNNSVGQLGDGTTTSRHTPADVLGLTSDVVAIAAGFDHTCALTSAGAVKCWGENGAGVVLGAESSETCISVFGDPHPCSTTPLDVETLDSGVAALSALGSFTCALTQDGGVKCWGSNFNGQLGDGTFGNSRRTPADVIVAPGGAPLTGVAAVSAGASHTCALMMTGGVKCWGSNNFGEVGDGSPNIDDRTTPGDVCQVYDADAGQCVGRLSGATAIAAGFVHTCALTEVGGVKCWGVNATGDLGIGTFDGLPHPVPVDMWQDWDGDGCSDLREQGNNPALGGRRDPKNFWDFFDIPDVNNVRDRAISTGDLQRLIARFGTHGNPNIDPFTQPLASGYHTAFDRSPPGPGGNRWNLGPPDGSVSTSDILFAVTQFGHTCV